MIDINLIRENPEEMKKKLAKKLVDVDFTELLEKDKHFVWWNDSFPVLIDCSLERCKWIILFQSHRGLALKYASALSFFYRRIFNC